MRRTWVCFFFFVDDVVETVVLAVNGVVSGQFFRTFVGLVDTHVYLSGSEIVGSPWTLSVVPGVVEPSRSTVSWGIEECEPGRLCGCVSSVGSIARFDLTLRDSFNNTATTTNDFSCSVTTMGIGIATSTSSCREPHHGIAILSIYGDIPTEYTVLVHVDGLEVFSSGFKTTFALPEPIDVNATMSYVEFRDDHETLRCTNGNYCGPFVDASSSMLYTLFQADSFGNLVTEGTGIVVTFIAEDSFESASALIGTGVALSDGTYTISFASTQATDWYVSVYLGVDIVTTTLIRVVPGSPSGNHTFLSLGDLQGPGCLASVQCDSEPQVAGEWGALYVFQAYDSYKNLIVQSLNFTVDTTDLEESIVEDDGNGIGKFQVLLTRAGFHAIRVYFDSEPSALLQGSDFLVQVAAGSPQTNTSSVVLCDVASCVETCTLNGRCPVEGSEAGQELLYAIDSFDVYDNPLADNAAASFLRYCSDPSCVSPSDVDATESSVLHRTVFPISISKSGTYWVFSSSDTVNNDPFLLTVIAGDPDPTASLIMNDESSIPCGAKKSCAEVDAGAESGLVVVAIDSYGNEWGCTRSNGCNFVSSASDVLVEFSFGDLPGPPIEVNSAGQFPSTSTLTAAGDTPVKASFLLQGTWVALTATTFVIVHTGPIDPSSCFVHNCSNEVDSSCFCETGVSCLSLTTGESATLQLSIQDSYGNMASIGNFTCEYEIEGDAGNCTNSSVPIHSDTAGTYTVNVWVGDDDDVGTFPTMVANSGLIVTISVGSISLSTTQLYRVQDDTYQYEQDGVLCVPAEFCGNAILPSASAYFLAVLFDEYGNRFSDNLDLSLEFSVSSSTGDVVVRGACDAATDGILGFNITLYTQSVYEINVAVGGLALAPFLVEYETLNLELYIGMGVNADANADVTEMLTDLRQAVADDLGVPVELLYVTEYVSGLADRRDASLYYDVTFGYSSNSQADLAAVEEAALQLDPGSLQGDMYQTEEIKEVSDNEDAVVAQVALESTITTSGDTTCVRGMACPSTAVSAGNTVEYAVLLVDDFENPLSIDFLWECHVHLFAHGSTLDTCADSRTSCGCEISQGEGVFRGSVRITTLHDAEYLEELAAYATNYQVTFLLNGYDLSRADWYLTVYASAADVEGSSVSLEEDSILSLVAGTAFDIQVTSRDRFGNVCAGSSDPWVSRVEPSWNTTTSQIFSLQPSSASGVYEYMFSKTRAGLYSLTFGLVTSNSYMFNSTVWKVEVSAAEANASTSTVSAFGLNEMGKFVAGTATEHAFEVSIYDSFGNAVVVARCEITVSYTFVESGMTANLSAENDCSETTPAETHIFRFSSSLDQVGLIEAQFSLLQDVSGARSHIMSYRITSLCPAGYVAVSSEESHPDSCVGCPSEGPNCTAPGQSLTSLTQQPGFWRESNKTLEFSACLNSDKYAAEGPECASSGLRSCEPCQGVSSWDGSASDGSGGQCRGGYRGRLCALCDPGYRRDKFLHCSECVSRPTLGGYLFVMTTLHVFFVAIRVWYGTSPRVSDQNLSFLMSLFANWLQALMIVMYIHLDFPLKDVLELSQPVLLPTMPELNMDCVFDYYGVHDKLYFRHLTVMLCIPGAMVAALALIAFCLVRFKQMVRRYNELMDREMHHQEVPRWFEEESGVVHMTVQEITEEVENALPEDPRGLASLKTEVLRRTELSAVLVSVVFVCLLLLHPALAIESLRMFLCVSVRADDGTKRYLFFDTSIECDGPSHHESLPFGVLGLVLYVVGVPAAVSAALFFSRSARTPIPKTALVSMVPDVGCADGTNELVALGHTDGTVSLLSCEVGSKSFRRTELEGHTAAVTSLAFSSDTHNVLCKFTLSDTCDSNINDSGPSGAANNSEEAGATRTRVVLDRPLSVLLSASADGSVCVWKAALPVSSSGVGANDSGLGVDSSVLDVDGSGCLCVLKGHRKAVLSVSASNDLSLVVSGGADRVVCVWDVARGVVRRKVKLRKVPVEVCCCPMGLFFAANVQGTSVAVWPADGEKTMWSRESGAFDGSAESLVVSPSGAHVAVAYSSSSVVVLQSRTGNELYALRSPVFGRWSCGLRFVQGPTSTPTSHSDEALLVAGFGSVSIWEFSKGYLVRQLEYSEEPSFVLPCHDRSVIRLVVGNNIVRHVIPKESRASFISRLRTESRFGFLFKPYIPTFHWWEILVILRKTALIVIVLLPETSTSWKALGCLGVVVASLLAHVWCWPYVSVEVKAQLHRDQAPRKQAVQTQMNPGRAESASKMSGSVEVAVDMPPMQVDLFNHVEALTLAALAVSIALMVCEGETSNSVGRHLVSVAQVFLVLVVLGGFLCAMLLIRPAYAQMLMTRLHRFVFQPTTSAVVAIQSELPQIAIRYRVEELTSDSEEEDNGDSFDDTSPPKQPGIRSDYHLESAISDTTAERTPLPRTKISSPNPAVDRRAWRPQDWGRKNPPSGKPLQDVPTATMNPLRTVQISGSSSLHLRTYPAATPPRLEKLSSPHPPQSTAGDIAAGLHTPDEVLVSPSWKKGPHSPTSSVSGSTPRNGTPGSAGRSIPAGYVCVMRSNPKWKVSDSLKSNLLHTPPQSTKSPQRNETTSKHMSFLEEI
eukprot:Rmarinus@m.25427